MRTIASLFVCLLVPALSLARTWTSTDGKTLEADFVSATKTHVTIRRQADGRRFTLPVDRLSEPDRQWIATQSAKDEPVSPLPDAIASMVSERGSILFEDDFNREDDDDTDDLGELWSTNSKNRAQGDKQTDLIDGALVMTISPRADHAISVMHHTEETYKDAVTYVRMKLDKGEQLKLAFNDRNFKAVHAGHINGVTINPAMITLADEREGRFSEKGQALKEDPSGADELMVLVSRTEKRFPIKLELGVWHDVVVVHKGAVMSAYIDGEEIGSFKSAGFSHPTKRQFAFAVPKRASVDELKIWKLAPKK